MMKQTRRVRNLLVPLVLATVAATTAGSTAQASTTQPPTAPVAQLSATAASESRPRWHHQDGPLIIGHRGASGYRPEHTLASYELAIRLGADYIEPDLVSTKDGVLVARHENDITGTTDVAEHPELAHLQTTKTIDGVSITGWFTEDLTLAELKTLRAVERIPDIRQENTIYDGRYEVPTLQEVIDLAARASREEGRTIGIYPETKHPTYFDSIGLSLEEPLVATLRKNRLHHRRAPVFIQSFETTNLRELDRMIQVPLVQLIGGTGGPFDLAATADPLTYADLVTPEGLEEIASYADGIGPDKGYIVPRDAEGGLLEPTDLVDDAHDEGLLVHPYTFRNENTFLPLGLRSSEDPSEFGDAFAEYQLFFDLGVDGVFSDQPDTAREARDAFLAERPAA